MAIPRASDRTRAAFSRVASSICIASVTEMTARAGTSAPSDERYRAVRRSVGVRRPRHWSRWCTTVAATATDTTDHTTYTVQAPAVDHG